LFCFPGKAFPLGLGNTDKQAISSERDKYTQARTPSVHDPSLELTQNGVAHEKKKNHRGSAFRFFSVFLSTSKRAFEEDAVLLNTPSEKRSRLLKKLLRILFLEEWSKLLLTVINFFSQNKKQKNEVNFFGKRCPKILAAKKRRKRHRYRR
jgi:hypothetical protein